MSWLGSNPGDYNENWLSHTFPLKTFQSQQLTLLSKDYAFPNQSNQVEIKVNCNHFHAFGKLLFFVFISGWRYLLSRVLGSTFFYFYYVFCGFSCSHKKLSKNYGELLWWKERNPLGGFYSKKAAAEALHSKGEKAAAAYEVERSLHRATEIRGSNPVQNILKCSISLPLSWRNKTKTFDNISVFKCLTYQYHSSKKDVLLL